MDPIGTKVNQRYTLQAELGRGGMATVYRAHDELLGRTLAIKLLAPDFVKREAVLRRFMTEAQVMVRLHHSNVVTVLDFDHLPVPFIAMELVNGGSVRDLLRGIEPPDQTQALDIIDGVLSGLIRTHAAGIIHRDIKPANILLTDAGVPKLTDFGIARDATRERHLTRTNAVLGTPAFMAPEQRKSAAKVTEASDLYAVGATLYTLLTRRSTVDLYVREHQEEAFVDMSPSLREFLSRACAFKESERFATAAAMQSALRAVRSEVIGQEHRGPTGLTVQVTAIEHHSDRLFFGRKDELEQMEAWAESKGARMLSLVGLGGIGKSRLALEFCQRHGRLFSGGVWIADLASCTTKDAVYREIGGQLGLNFESTDPLAEIAGRLRAEKDCLLFLDNAEDAALPLVSAIRHLIEWVPELRILVTTREAIGVRLESLLSVNELDDTASVALLMDAARQTFDLEERTVLDATSLEKIAHLLEGHPLSLELAAAQLQMLGAAQLHARLERALDVHRSDDAPTLMGVLDNSAGLGATPSSSVQSSLAWSWSLLSHAEQAVLTQCAVFVDGFDVEAAERVVELHDVEDAPPVMILLQALRTKNLIRIHTPLPGCRRLSVPRLVGYFALAHGDPQMSDGARTRMALHYAPMGDEERIHKSQTSSRDSQRIAALDLPNVLSAFDRAHSEQDGETAARLCLAAAQLLKHTGPFERLTQMLDDVDLLLDDTTPLRARVIHHRAGIAMTREPLEVVRAQLERAIALGDALDVVTVRTAARVNLAYVLSRTNRLERGLEVAEAAVTIAEASGGPRHLPSTLYCRGHLTNKSGRPGEALTDYEAALVGYQRLGDRFREGTCYGNLGEYHHNIGEPTIARRYYDHALAIARELGDRSSMIRAQRRIAWLHMDAARWPEARDALEAGLALARVLGDLPGEASLVGTLGTIAAHEGDDAQALSRFREARSIYRTQGNEEQFQRCEINICVLLERAGRIDEATESLERLKLTQGMLSATLSFIQTLEMKLMLRRSEWDNACTLGQRILPVIKKKQYWEQAISVHAYLATCEAARGNNPADHLAEAESIMARLQLAEGSDSGQVIAEARAHISELQRP